MPGTETDELELTPPEASPPGLNDIPVLLFIRGLTAVGVVLSVLLLLHRYLGLRLLTATGVPEPFSTLLWLALWGGFVSMFLSFLAMRFFPRPVAKVAQWVGFGWMGAFGLLLTGTVLADLAVAVATRLGVVEAEARVVAALCVVGGVAPALVIGFWVARRPRVKRFEVPMPGLDRALDGFTVVQLTDVHVGEMLGQRYAARLVERVNALGADLVAVTGDLVDGPVARLEHEVAPLAGLAAPHGVFFVTGNHEYYHGGHAWTAHARKLGMTVLHNEHRVVERGGGRLVVGGVTDVEGGRFAESHAPDVARAFAGAPAGVPRLLLAHQPRFAKHAQGHQVSLMLSGHTHGGQIFPFMFLVRLQQPVIAGLKELWGVRTYTSRGTGYWGPPFRVGTRGEIAFITLRAA